MKTALILMICLLMASTIGFAEDDTRQKVNFPEMMQQHMLANMRDHLQTLTKIQQFMANGDYDKAAEIAEQRLGLSSLDSHGAAHMAQMMPREMQAIGTAMHKAASQFAITIEETGADGDIKRALADLSKVTQQCVACHSAYRIH